MLDTSTQRFVQVTAPAGQPVKVPIPRRGRFVTRPDETGALWLTVRTWWGRTVVRTPISTPVLPPLDCLNGLQSWGGYCGDATHMRWITPFMVNPYAPVNVDHEIGVVEMEILGELVPLTDGRGLLMSPDKARTTAMRLLAVAAAAEEGVAALDAKSADAAAFGQS